MAVGLVDPPLNHDVNPLEELMEKECTLVINVLIFTVKDGAFSRNTSCDELDVIRWFFYPNGGVNITQKFFYKICIPRITVIEITKDDKCYRITFLVLL
jgi:hypothetical protein